MRFYRSLAIVIVLLIAFHTLACTPQSRYEYSYEVMGTGLSVIIEGESMSEAKETADAVMAEMWRINSLMSVWIEDSELSRLNREATIEWTETDPEIIALLKVAQAYSARSNGAFDVTAGPLVRLWGFFALEKQQPPSHGAIVDKLAVTGWEKLEIDEDWPEVHFSVPGIEIDLGGIAKGYAVDRSLQIITQQGFTSALVNLGGNVSFTGLPGGRTHWNIAVRDPRVKDEILGYLRLGENYAGWGVASSGQYERYFEYEGKRYGHIIDPRTGYPAEDVVGTTILASSAMRADILSTATFVLGVDEGLNLLAREKNAYGMIIKPTDDGGLVIHMSKELAGHFELDANKQNVRTVLH
jgi:thiamine biosynthesis lipoprotein